MLSHTSLQKSSRLLPGRVVGSVIALPALTGVFNENLSEHCDIVEFRADGFPPDSSELQRAMAGCPLPALLTVRRPDEGGLNALSSADRGKKISTLLPLANLLDLEIASLSEFPDILHEAREREIPVIASLHDFQGTPDKAILRAAADRARSLGADAVKFATTLRHSGDLSVLTSLQEEATFPMATMGMGPLGRVSRLLLGSLGSVLNYGYLDQPTVPGQWPAARLRELIRELRGEE